MHGGPRAKRRENPPKTHLVSFSLLLFFNASVRNQNLQSYRNRHRHRHRHRQGVGKYVDYLSLYVVINAMYLSNFAIKLSILIDNCAQDNR